MLTFIILRHLLLRAGKAPNRLVKYLYFPEEMRFSNLNYASEIAARYIDFSCLTVLQQWLVTVQFIQKVSCFF